MKKIIIFFIPIITFSQEDCTTCITFSLESKFGEGTSIKNSGTEEPYNYFENLLDVNIQFNSGVSLWSQLEYSDPPVFGLTKDGLNKFYFEYSNGLIDIKAGDIYTLYGNGLGLNIIIDQNVDLDNSIKGLEFNYYTNDQLRLYSLIGKGRYDYRSNPAMVISDRSIYNTIYTSGFEYNFDNFGTLQGYLLNQSSEINQDMMILYNNEYLDSRIGKEFYNRVPFENFRDDTLTSNIKNLSWFYPHDLFDFIIEYSQNNYLKLLGDEELGYKLYGSVSTFLGGFGITYEYKDYNEPYFIQSISGAPIVYRESTSILASRYTHSINFGDEIGHQLEIQKSINDNLNWMMNISQANTHIGEYYNVYSDSTGLNQNLKKYKHSNPFSLILMNYKDEDIAFKPFRQFYTEISGYTANGHLFFQIGLDQLDEVYKYHNTLVRDFGDLDIEQLISDVEIEINNIITNELAVIDNQHEIDLNGISSIYQQYYDACYLWGLCNGLSPEEYASNSFEYDFNISYQDSLSILESNYYENYSIREEELVPEMLDYKRDELYSKKYSYEKQNVFTIPNRFSWKFKNGASISTYWEYQWRNVDMNHDYILLDGTIDRRTTNIEEYYNQYISFSYRSTSKWSMTYFYDSESHEKKLNGVPWSEEFNTWTGVDFSIDINSSSQLSVFYGSQKGGRVCANGICADQPGFKDGFKLTYRSFF